MQTKPPIITKDTLIPVTLVGTMISILIGGTVFLTNISNKLQDIDRNAARIEILERNSIQLTDKMARIETKIDIIIEKFTNEYSS